jgi:hypothetical protein
MTIRTALPWLGILAGCPAPGVCELEYEGGRLCYEIGDDSHRGYHRAECRRQGDRWTDDVTCVDRGYDLVCSTDDGYLVHATDPATCCAFGHDCEGACTCGGSGI